MLERTGREPGLLPKLPSCGRLRGLQPFPMAARQLPEPAEKTLQGSALDEVATPADQRHDRAPVDRPSGPGPTGRDPVRVEPLPAEPAVPGDRTDRASRCAGGADRLTELHHGLGKPSRGLTGELPGEDRGEPGPDVRSVDPAGFTDPPGGDPETVRFQGNDRLSERLRGQRPSDVGPDPGEPLELGRAPGPPAPVEFDQLPGGPVEVAGPGVVAHPLPGLEHLRAGRPGERPEGGEPPDKPTVGGDRLVDPGLLEDHLGDPDPVRVRPTPPRERPGRSVEPAPERPGSRGRRTRAAFVGHTGVTDIRFISGSGS